MLTLVLVSAVLAGAAIAAHIRSPRIRREVVRFFELHSRYYRPDGCWLRSGYVASAFGMGVYHHLRELAAAGVLERREGGTSRERWARGARPVVYYRLRAR